MVRSYKISAENWQPYAFTNLQDYRTKASHYARMSAEKYFLEGKRAGVLKRFFSPVFNGVNDVFYFGFLEGQKGLALSRTIARYTWLKYYYLWQLRNNFSNQKLRVPVATALKSLSRQVD